MPSHTSATVALGLVPATDWPTAVQEFAAVHEIPASELPKDKAGLGVFWATQVVPFHNSASVTCWNVLLK